jgi:hypothetical protein
MKETQWIVAGVVVIVMVFGITFAVNYMGTSPPPTGGPTDDNVDRSEVTFTETEFPKATEPPLEQEVRQPGHHDFWFTNGNDKPVKVGLDSKNCTCSNVQLFLAPAGVSARPEEARMKELENSLTPVQLVEMDPTKEAVAVVPAKGSGWVRLGWSGERNQAGTPITLRAKLWMNQKNGLQATLDARVRFLEPLQVVLQDARDREIQAGELTEAQLPHTLLVTCFSGTRPKFQLKTRVIGLQTVPRAEPVAVGQPVPLTAEECRTLEQHLVGDRPARVQAGYRVPVVIRGKLEDGTLVDAGPFRRRIELEVEGLVAEPITVTVAGRIQGDVIVGDQEDGGRVLLGQFDRKRGSRQFVAVRSDRAGLKLEFDRERTPAFLNANLPDQPSVSAEGRSTWRVEVEVLPNRARGTFPRENDTLYRDSAVYLRVVGSKTQSVRIPVGGTANDR